MNAPAANPFLEAALAYARRGWPVFPCHPSPHKPKSKSPLLPKASAQGAKDGGFYLASTNETQIRDWWKRWPRALIGLRTGLTSKLLVLDLDPREHAADTMLRAVADFCGGMLPPCPVARTQSGGLHLYFAHPDPDDMGDVDTISKNNLFKHIPGVAPEIVLHVDVRGEGGYVIAPPSVMEDGKFYGWEADIDDVGLPPVPGRLFDAMLRRGEFAPGISSPAPSSSPAPAVPPSADPVREAIERYGLAAYAKEIDALSSCPQGQRGSELNRTGFVLGKLVGAGALSRSVAAAGLREACSRNGLAAVDGWPKTEATIERSLSAGEREPRDLSDIERQARERAQRRGARQIARLRPVASEPDRHHSLDPGGGEFDADDDDNDPPEPPLDDGGDSEPPEDSELAERLAECSRLDHSDTDNGKRLIRYFGQDLAVMAQDEVPSGTWLSWAGTHWDIAGGAARARITVQKLGSRILLEADHLKSTPSELRMIAEGESARPELDQLEQSRAEWNDEDRARARRLQMLVDAGEDARAALDKRKIARRKFAISSKNKARMEAALDCAAPRLRRPPDSFNPDRYKVATLTHTLKFERDRDDECPDPKVERFKNVRCVPIEGHDRDDWITAVVPVRYLKGAQAPKWRKFLERMLTDPAKRRTVQQFTALGLLGVPVQYLMFHYGLGANGKSVFLETVTRLLGPGLAVGLPRESIVGASERSAGSASPDLVRLYGKRMVRILEVKGDAPLQDDLVKRLTGGESVPVRTLFKGYFEFQNVATAHMSGNGFPTIDGGDNGIWRRLLVVHWDQTIPEEERRDFEEVVGEFIREEGEGILAWMIEGVLDYLENGLVIADSVRSDTADYREEMDPVGEFRKACVREAVGVNVPAAQMYEAYVSWSMANAKRPKTQTKFGKMMAQHFRKQETGGRIYYVDCELHDVPARPDAPRNPSDSREGYP